MIKKPTVIRLPSSQLTLPVIPIREGVLFPHTESVLTFGRKISIAGVSESVKSKKLVVLLTQKDSKVNDPSPLDLYRIGTLAIIERTIKSEEGISALARGIGRVKVNNFIKTRPAMVASVSRLSNIYDRDDELKALATHLQKEFKKTIQMGKPVEFLNFMKLLGGVREGELADQVASTLNLKTQQKQDVLETLNIKKRLKLVIEHLSHELKVMEIEKDVVHKTQAQFDKHMRESVLRERLKTIQKELGEIDDEEEQANDYSTKLKKAKFSQEIKKKVNKEIKRLKQMSPNNPETGYITTWLDTVFDLPWEIRDAQAIDLKKANKILDKNHYGLKDVKDRVLEHIAVLQQKQKTKTNKDDQLPTILCFVGPPGVGKTSIGRAIAESIGRKFTKISLGGVTDEADIRGHRKTYVGAMPGRIINAIKSAKSVNPVFMMDEIDKLGRDHRGDPSAALLEVLDPEQNKEFEDHYLDMPFDLSEVLFITTANTLDTIPPALKDRLEIIRYSGYTQEDKFNIAKKHLIKKVLKNNGLKTTELKLTDKTLNKIIKNYTREAGVRDLERNLNATARKAVREILENNKKVIDIDKKILAKFLGPEKFSDNFTEKKDQIGLATGLAWTSVGGDILFIEVALYEGTGKIKLTGKLGEVMKESAQAALTYVKANAKTLGIKPKKLQNTDVHIHVPEGAVPKDGPSAGITITTAIVSAFTNKKVRKDIAMTGEVTLRGRILPIGGLKEKSIAAHRAGSKLVLIPKENKKDLINIPKSVKKEVEFKAVGEMSEVLKLALV
jgi:ATP-dependent Lon protease